VGTASSFSIQMMDAYNNTIQSPAYSPKIAVLFTGPQNTTATVSYVGLGLYSATYTFTVAGSYVMTVSVNGSQIINSPFRLSVLTNDIVWAPNCFAWGENLVNYTAGEEGLFHVQTVDFFNNTILNNQTIPWEIIILSTRTSYHSVGEVTYISNGVYEIFYNATVSGPFEISVVINGTAIRGSPFGMVSQPAETFGPMCTATGPGLLTTYTGSSETLTITAYDRFGNLRLEGGELFDVVLSDHVNGATQTTSEVDNENGNYTVSYTLQESGEYLLSIQIHNMNIQGSPWTIECKWSGLPTYLIIVIGSSCVAVAAAGLFAFWIYRKKFRKRATYEPIRE